MALEDGTKVRVHYRGTLDDGSEFDNSYTRGEPIEFEVGAGLVITGFDEAVKGMDVGDKLSVKIRPRTPTARRSPRPSRSSPSTDCPRAPKSARCSTVRRKRVSRSRGPSPR